MMMAAVVYTAVFVIALLVNGLAAIWANKAVLRGAFVASLVWPFAVVLWLVVSQAITDGQFVADPKLPYMLVWVCPPLAMVSGLAAWLVARFAVRAGKRAA